MKNKEYLPVLLLLYVNFFCETIATMRLQLRLILKRVYAFQLRQITRRKSI